MDDAELNRRTSLPKELTTECIHGIIPEWCWECKHKSTTTVKSLLLQENLKIVENLLSWPNKSRTI